ncbi:mandelate racemase/muconate lactonizing enzyme family protein [Falsiroseomonas sp.]|uniref:mandelate racemase/muconate lactonizing enzyme family protein n=1 Tax=Falsiroseomonas sp. TaxID=2870721 RepID=UPI00273579DC|nr:mandelate racemase/muconate lactonizing enzyme family protein [Falsiroseomonas sp.]MDP3418966.1 mandelate racemase/muconate lactonizing enzyme family protein [Falsiroseomonas sp.]
MTSSNPRITAIRTHLMQAGPLGVSGWGDVKTSITTGTRNWLFVTVETDAGITGLGEGSGWPRVVETAVADLAHLLIGQDAFDIERISQRLTVAMMGHGMNGVVGQGAIAAIDTALWDIKGQALGVPIWQLLGGRMRDRIRCYTHASTPEQAKDAVARGYTAIKTGGVANPVAKAQAIRAAISNEVDLMIDLHGPPWLNLPDAIEICRELGKLRPLFVEEPLAPENMEGYRALRRAVDVPLAAGERHGGLHGVAPLLFENLVDVIQPDSGRAGGLTGLRKLAGMAEARFATVAPHSGSLGPVAEYAAIHLLAAIPNALILERMDPDWPGRAQVTNGVVPEMQDGHVLLPTAPGLGVTLNEAFVTANPSIRNCGLPSGGWPKGTEPATLYNQPRTPRMAILPEDRR